VLLALGSLVLLVGGAAALSLATAPASIPQPQVYGAPGQRFSVSFIGRPTFCHDCLSSSNKGQPVDQFIEPDIISMDEWDWHFKENASVWTMRSNLASRVAISLSQATAATIVLHPRPPRAPTTRVLALGPCRTLTAAPCSGYAGDLTILDGSTMYNVYITGVSEATAEAVLDSFSLVAPQR